MVNYTVIQNNFKKFRMEFGLKQTEVAEKINSRQRLISNIELGFHHFGPYYLTTGKIRPWVRPACKLFKVSIKDIWPIQYKEKLKEIEKPFCGHQLMVITTGYYSTNTCHNKMDNHLCIMSLIDKKLDKKQKDFVIRHIVHDETLESIGQSYNLTRERVRQVISESVLTLKKYIGT